MHNNTFRDKFFLPLLLLLFIFVIIASVYAMLFNYNEAEAVAKEVLLKTSSSVTNHIINYIDPAIIANGFIEDYFLIHQYQHDNTETIERLAMLLMDRYPTLRAFNLGFNNGDFFMVKREAHGTYSTKIIYRSLEDPYILWRYRDARKKVIREELDDLDEYDPRLRPWYIGAMQQNGIYWSEIYTLFTDKDLGITVGYPLREGEEIIGVFSFDLKVTEIAEYISKVQISDHGEAIIVNYKKDLIAIRSTMYDSSKDTVDAPVALDRISDPVIRKSYELIDSANNEVTTFTINNLNYYLVYRDLDDVEGAQWKIGVIVPENDFLSGFKLTTGLNAFTIFTIGILVLLLNYYRYSETKIKQQLLKSSECDTLTGLLNRRSLSRIYQLIIKDKRKTAFPLGIILCDIDHFKIINDTYGHNGGDFVLKEISNLMHSNLRDKDYLCRWGGEEFLIILQNSDIHQVTQTAEKLKSVIEGYTIVYNNQEIKLTMSFGANSYEEQIDLDKIISEVDAFLYQAKSSGRNRVIVPKMN